MSSPLLEAQNVAVERGGRQLLENFSLRLCAGDIVHLQGENGAGKTSLLRVLSGLSRFGYEGAIKRAEIPLYIGHLSSVKAPLTVRENLLWHPSGESFDDPKAVDGALNDIGLTGYEDRPAGQLSAGQQRRVNLVRLYLTQRRLWLLDEPFTAIDKLGVERLQDRIQRHADNGGAVLLTSHQTPERLADVRVLQLEAPRDWS